MYEILYEQNIVLKSLISLLFISLNIAFSVIVSKKNILKDKLIISNFGPLLIFFLTFFLYVFLINCSIIINYKILKYSISLTIIIQLIYIFKNLNQLKGFLDFRYISKNYILLIYFILFFLISSLPISDADSIAIYQFIPSSIFLNGFNDLDLVKNLEFTLVSNAEILLIISAYLKSDNFGAILNLVTLFFVISLVKNNKNFFFILLSSPLIIYFISTQKLQLFFAVLFLILFVLAHTKKIQNKFEIFVFALLLTFFSSGKFYYLIFSFILFCYFFLKNKNDWKNIILYFFISFLLVYSPIFIIKHIYFGNIIAPFFDEILGNGLESYKAFQNSIRTSEGWISNPGEISQYLRPFISFKMNYLSSSLGLVFLIMLLDFKLLKSTFFIPLIIILSIFSTGQALPRYFFEAFLILAYYFSSQNKVVKFFIFSQIFVITSIALMYIYLSYIKYNVIYDVKRYMNNFSYSYYNHEQINKVNLDGNILDLSLDRQSIFFNENVFSARYLNIQNNYNLNNKNNLKNFLKKKSIKYIITDDIKNLPNCIELKQIDTTYRKIAVRNFLINSKKNLYKVFKINNNC